MTNSQRGIIIVGTGVAGLAAACLTPIAYASAQPEGKSRPLEVTAESKDGKAYIRIIGRIADWNRNNSRDFQRQVDELLKAHTDCEVYLNSNGGSVLEATEINNQLKRFKNVTITIGASAASAATYFTSHHYTKAYGNSQLMIHKPMLGTFGNEDQISKDLKLLKNITKDYISAYSKKTGKTPAEIEALWQGGDHWMSAEEAKADGFIDEIINEDANISAEDVKILEACGAPILPAPTASPKPEPNTSKIMTKEEKIAFLGLEANATDAQIDAGMTALKVDALKQRAATKAAATAQANADAEKVNALVDQAIKDKKITADQKQTYVDLATASYDAAKTALDAMVSKPKLSADLTPDKGDEDLDKARANWTLDDYMDKDPAAYEKMKIENPEKAEALEAAYFGATK